MTPRPTESLLRILALTFVTLIADVSTPAANAAKATAAKPGAAKSTPQAALQRIQRTVAMLDAEAKTPEGEAAVRKRLSVQLAASEDSLRSQHDAWGLGYGEVAMAYGFARASRTGKTPAEVVEMRTTGTAWLDIAKKLGVNVETVAQRMRRHLGPKSRT